MMKKIFLLLATVFAAQRLLAQVTTAPLPLYITGSGKVVPFHDGQMLDVGRDYIMLAIPDRGYKFSSWQPVDVFTFVEYTMNSSGNLVGITNTVVGPEDEYIKDPFLVFTMQPEDVLFDVPDVKVITSSEGWQANFVPIERDKGR